MPRVRWVKRKDPRGKKEYTLQYWHEYPGDWCGHVENMKGTYVYEWRDVPVTEEKI
jgi:hypothetical protein